MTVNYSPLYDLHVIISQLRLTLLHPSTAELQGHVPKYITFSDTGNIIHVRLSKEDKGRL